MPAIVPPSSALSPVVPGGVPDSTVASVEATTPPADSGNDVAFKDLPQRAQQIIVSAQKGDNKVATDLLNEHIDESKDYHPNTQPQIGKMFFSALAGRWGDVYKYYNGGATREEPMRNAMGQIVGYREYNEVGDTGRFYSTKTDKNGNKVEVSLKQMQPFIDSGFITPSDQNALKTSNWKNAQLVSENAIKGFATQTEAARTTAYAAANAAASSNHNLEEQIQNAKRNAAVYDAFSTFTPEKRQKILGFVNRYNTNSQNLNQSNEKGGSSYGGGQQGATVNGGYGPLGENKGGLSAGVGGSASTNQGLSEREANATAQARSKALQEQQNIETAIMQEMQGAIKTPEQFRDFMRLQSLNNANREAMNQVPDTVKPPGWQNVADSDPHLGGSAAMIENMSTQLRNNALMAAWTSDLFKSQRNAAKTGQTSDVQSLARNFENSDMFKAINNTYSDKQNVHLGRARTLKKGDLIVDKSNNIFQAN